MPPDRMQLCDLLEKVGAEDFLRERIGFLVQSLMDLDVANRCGAAHGERTEARSNSRNGYRDRTWETRAGTVALRIPKLRTGSTSRPFWSPSGPPRRRWRPLFRKPTCSVSPRERWTTSSRRWG
jgi:putative transposase